MLTRIFNIILSFILLIATTGFSISQHFCREQLVNIGVFSEAKPCNHEVQVSCCSSGDVNSCQSGLVVSDNGCCSDENKYFRFDEEFTVNSKDDARLLSVHFLPLTQDYISTLQVFFQKIHQFPPQLITLPPPDNLQAYLQVFHL